MSHYKNTITVDPELLIQRYKHGIRLIKPGKQNSSQYKEYSLSSSQISSVHEVYQQPVNFYFNSGFDCIQSINDATAKSCGFTSAQSAVGKSMMTVAKKETAEFSKKHDQAVMRSKQMIIAEEYYQRLDDVDFSVIAIKTPWYGRDDKIAGIFGCSIVLGEEATCSLANALTILLQTNLFSNPINLQSMSFPVLDRNVKNTYLTARQLQCARLLLFGKTAKEIAKILELSPRTVEQYFETMKTKLNVSSKSELIEKIITENLV